MMGKYAAVLFMYNDENRARFVIDNWLTFNSNIPLMVYDGSSIENSIERDYSDRIEYTCGANLWHKKTRHPPGSFNYLWFNQLNICYDYLDEPEYLIFLETDVKVQSQIVSEPLYDVSGPITRCGGITDELMMYDFWDAYLKGENFHEDKFTNWKHKFHSGCGATALSRKFFDCLNKNLDKIKLCYDNIPMHCYQDLVLSCFARSAELTLGDWMEVSDTRGTYRRSNRDDDSKWYFDGDYSNKALVHNYKI